MADATSTRVSIVRETEYGVLPANPQMQMLRFNSSNLSANITSTTSDEINDTRNISDSSMVGVENSGDIETELSLLSHDQLIEGAMFSSWSRMPEVTNKAVNSPIASISDDTVTLVSGGAVFEPGMIVKLSGFAEGSLNRKAVVVSSSATELVLDRSLGTAASAPIGTRIKAVGVQAETDDIVATANGLTSTILDFTELNIAVGCWVKLGGSATATRFTRTENNGFCRVSFIGENMLTFDIVPEGFDADSGSGKTIEIFTGDYIRNGTTRHSYSVEQLYLDTTPVVRQMFRGVVVGSLSLSMEAQSIVTCSFNLMGSESEYMDVAPTGQSYYRLSNTEILNTSSNVGRIAEAGARIAGRNCIMSAAINLDNNLRGRPCIGSLAYRDIGAGRCNVSGNLNTYFGSAILAKKILSNEESSVDFRFSGLDSSTVIYDLPRLKFTEGSTPISGIDSDVMLDAGFQALVHPTENYTLHIQSFDVTE